MVAQNLRLAALVLCVCVTGFPACRRRADRSTVPDAGAAPTEVRDVLCVERPEGCVWCEGRGTPAPLLDSDEPRPSLCNPKDDESCVDFCSRLTPECALPWSGVATCVLPTEEEFRRATFWRGTDNQPEATLYGRVVDETGNKRIEGAKIRVWFAGTAVADDSSGKDGLFRIRLRTGPRVYAVRVSHAGRASEIAELRLAPPEKPEKQPAAPRLFRLGPESIIRGKVVDAAGAPVVGVTVHAVRTPEDAIDSGHATSGEDGTFAVGGLEAKRYFLRASKFGWLPFTLKPPVAAPAVRVTIKLIRTGVLRGLVVDSDDDPEPNGTVVALLSGGAFGSANSPIFWTADAEGRFAQDRFAPGIYYVWARYGEMLVYPPEKLEISEETLDVDLKLALGHRGARLSGRVVAREGFALEADTRIVLRSRSPLAFPRNAVGQADREGRFVVSGVLPGRYEVTVRSGGRALGISRGAREVEVPIEAGSSVVLPDDIIVRPQPEE